MPQFPNDVNNLTRDDAINQILSSIAMEELGMSHIINAEGEKLQYVLGTLAGANSPAEVTIDQVLEVNESVQKLLQTAGNNQVFLKAKMSDALNSSTLQGPAGPKGDTGATGAAGSAIVQDYSGTNASSYAAGQLVNYNNSVYLAIVADPTGTPDLSSDYIQLSRTSQLLYSEMQLIGASGAPFDADALIIFDQTVNDNNPNVTYDNVTGEFTLAAGGSYEINWWTSCDVAAENPPSVSAALVVDGTSTSIASSTFVQTVCFVSGATVVQTTNTPSVVAVKNVTGTGVSYVIGQTQAGILIKQRT